ncbi:MAG TPA: MaoC family dehydratase [Burkholderiales bacterium]|nr:MaoC family dehydratase [Burkholderiales bacterium]
MPQITLDSSEQLKDLIGKEVVVSDWLTVTQQHINLFAEATGDRQWIHVDVARAERESPFNSTIAHGFLTLSLLGRMLDESLKLTTIRMGVNYGLNKVRFPDVVPVGARVRARFVLQAMETASDNGMQLTWHVVMERDGAEKPCLVAEWLTRFY